jgi:hypothetical protein
LTDGLHGYSQFFQSKGRQAHLVVEATPSYIYSKLALQVLPGLPSNPHFLFILREPVEQIRSIYHYFQSNWNWLPAGMSFRDFVSASDSHTDIFKGNELARDALKNASYVDFLTKWRAACGANRIHVFVFEEFFSDQHKSMQALARQYGIAESFYDTYDFPRENETYSVRSAILHKLNIFARPMIPRGRLYDTTRSIYRRLNTTKRPADLGQDSEFEIGLSQRYREANERLAAAFNLEITRWADIAAARNAPLSGSGGRLNHVAG